MRKSFITAIFLLLFSVNAFAAGSCTQSLSSFPDTMYPPAMYVLKFVCTGDAVNGSIPDTPITATTANSLYGMYFYTAVAYPTSGGETPDAADVTVTMQGRDLLGGKGVNLIHATATQSTAPYNTFSSVYEYTAIIDTLTVAVANQATASANYTIDLVFAR